MITTALWKSLAVSAMLAGFGSFVPATAQAAPPPSRPASTAETTGGADTTRVETNGSTAIHTSPRATSEVWTFGPHVNPVNVWLVAD